MNYEEFLDKRDVTPQAAGSVDTEESVPEPEELDVQKAVVEELAADKAKLDVQMQEMGRRIESLEALLAAKSRELDEALADKKVAVEEIEASFRSKIAELEQKGGLGIIAKELNKGNWKERTFRTTSRQYKDFIQAMKDFENPRSDGYQAYANLTLTANDYLIHKGVHSIEEAMAACSLATD